MPEYNLLSTHPKSIRDIASRRENKDANRKIASKFGAAYFDGPRTQGYGGYTYDGRWKPVAAKIIQRYALEAGMSVLDIGCAKGFLVKDLADALPGLTVTGLDISSYALNEAPTSVRKNLVNGDCRNLPFKDNQFDTVICINTIHNVDQSDCIKSLQEIMRVSKGAANFVQIDAFTNEDEKMLFEDWMLTAKTYGTPESWKEIFNLSNYAGDYYWTILSQE